MLSIKVKGLGKALKVIAEQGELADERKELFLKQLADTFQVSLYVHFYYNWSLYIDNPSPVTTGVRVEGDGYAVYAQGEQVAFIEFGAGVYYNGGGNYLLPRPKEIAKIGEFGQGKGKQQTWGYYDDTGALHLTHGNPPANAFYHASEDIRSKIAQIAEEVFA